MPSNHLILCHPLLLCLQSFPASRSFLMNRPYTLGGQSIGASVSASGDGVISPKRKPDVVVKSGIKTGCASTLSVHIDRYEPPAHSRKQSIFMKKQPPSAREQEEQQETTTTVQSWDQVKKNVCYGAHTFAQAHTSDTNYRAMLWPFLSPSHFLHTCHFQEPSWSIADSTWHLRAEWGHMPHWLS